MAAATNLERYRRISSLGVGGMSSVALAEDTVLGRRVALKRMHATGDDRRLSRLRREALIGASMSHPNLVPIYDILTLEDGDQVIVMEYVEGETLRDAVRREGRLEIPEALRVLDGVAAALDAIHEQGIVHRDVKPANILLGADGTTKLADLGVASSPDRTQITTEGGVVGTFSYMAPEQLGGSPATPAADVYALAAVAFEALSGRKARTEPNPLALAHAIATESPPDLRDPWPEAPEEAARLLVRGMSREQKDRPRSAGELTARLRAALAPEATAALPVEKGQRGRKGRKAARDAVAGDAVAGDAVAGDAAPLAAGAVGAAALDGVARDRDRAASPVAEQAASPVANGAARSVADPARRPPTPPPARPAQASAPGRRRGAWVIPAALIVLVAAAVALAALLSGGGSKKSASHSSVSTPARSATKPGAAKSRGTSTTAGTSSARTTSGSGSTSSTPSSSSPGTSSSPAASSSPGAPATAAGSPVSAVERFYNLAAAHDYSAAWPLADPSFQQQLHGYSGFQSTFSADRSITFDSAQTVSQSASSATVEVHTTSVQSNGTQHCTGTVQLVPGSGGGWLLHQIGISCS